MNNTKRRLIFMDGEFCELTSKGVKFLSLAFISDTGDELYLEIEQPEEIIDPWVKENVVPKLEGNKVTEEDAINIINQFIYKNYGDTEPVLVADVNQFDWNGLCELFGVWDIPFFYIPIDFSTVLYMKNIDIDIAREDLANELGIDVSNFKKHNALDDARIMKRMFDILCSD